MHIHLRFVSFDYCTIRTSLDRQLGDSLLAGGLTMLDLFARLYSGTAIHMAKLDTKRSTSQLNGLSHGPNETRCGEIEENMCQEMSEIRDMSLSRSMATESSF